MRPFLALAVVASLLIPRPAGSQETIRSVTRLIQINVIAQEKAGEPVTDLAASDFAIYDNGQKQEIKLFTLDRGDRTPPATAPVVTASGPVVGREFTNQEQERTGPNAVTVFLLDSLNTDWATQSQAARVVLRYLSQVRPEDHVAIYSINAAGLRVIYDFTTDASDLVAELAKWKGELPEMRQPDLGAAVEIILRGKNQPTQVNQGIAARQTVNKTNAEITPKIFETLAQRLAGVPGRKNVIWISNGFPEVEFGGAGQTAFTRPGNEPVLARSLDPRNTSFTVRDSIGDSRGYKAEVDQSLKVLASANVAVYAIEARGLQTGMPDMAGNAAGQGQFKGSTPKSFSEQGEEAAMVDIAKRTGGQAFINHNDMLGAIRAAVDDSKVSYTLGFYPTSAKQNDSFHKITVKLAGPRPGVTLRYRAGYLDEAAKPGDNANRREGLNQVAVSPIDANAVPLTAQLTAVADRYVVNLKIGLSGLNVDLVDGRWTDDVDVLLLQRDRRGNEFARVNETIGVRLSQPTYLAMLKSGVPYRREVKIDPNASLLRVVVRDARSGNVGSVTIPLVR